MLAGWDLAAVAAVGSDSESVMEAHRQVGTAVSGSDSEAEAMAVAGWVGAAAEDVGVVEAKGLAAAGLGWAASAAAGLGWAASAAVTAKAAGSVASAVTAAVAAVAAVTAARAT